MVTMTENIPVVEMRNIKKNFAAVRALRGVDLTLRQNEVLGLVGDNADGTEIGPAIWGEFATIQSVYNDPCDGATGLEYLGLDHPGFGGW